MTAQTKHFIELTDIAAMRCDCKGCGTSVVVPLKEGVSDAILSCPKCRKPWIRFMDSSHEAQVNAVVTAIENLKHFHKNLGCEMTLEISGSISFRDPAE